MSFAKPGNKSLIEHPAGSVSAATTLKIGRTQATRQGLSAFGWPVYCSDGSVAARTGLGKGRRVEAHNCHDGYGLFAVDISYFGNEIVLALRGELDLLTRPQFVAALALAQAREARVVLDLTDLVYIDACNIRVIHQARKFASMRGTQLVLQAPSAQVLRILELTGLGPAVLSHEKPDSIVLPVPYHVSDAQFQQA